MESIHRTIVAALLISADRKILLGKQRQGGVYPDCWHFPGGGVEAGESKEEALTREIIEEVGIDISGLPKILLSDQDAGSAEKTNSSTGERFLAMMHFNTYRVDLPWNAGDISVCLQDDLTEYEWAEITDLGNYRHTPPSTKILVGLGYLAP